MKYRIELLLAFSIFFGFGAIAQTEKSVDSKVSDVTVFLQGAQVSREATVNLVSGENVVKLSGLTPYLDANSVQVEGNSNFTILSVKHQINYLEDQSLSPAIKSKRDSLKDLEFKLDMRRAMRNVYNEEKSMIVTNKNIKGQDANLLAEDLLEVSDFFRNRLKEIEFKLLEINQEEKKLNETIQRLRNDLNALNARWTKNSSEIEVRVKTNKALKTDMQLSYLIRNAGWMPVYDLRASDIGDPVEMSYKAKVYQSSGFDWNRVNLTLSTGNPSAGGVQPVLYPWYLQMYDPTTYKQSRGKMNNAYGAPAMEQEELRYDDADVAGYMQAIPELTTTQQTLVNTEFVIGIPYDIPSDNKQYDVEVQRFSLPADYTYYAVPKMEKEAFLLARVTDWNQYSLLPGESNIYYQGTFVGKAYIDPVLNSDTLDLSMGRDKSVVVSREQIDDFCKTSTLGSKKSTTKSYRIKITNGKARGVDIIIKDQIPLTNTSEIEVEAEELSGGKLDEETGFVEWDMTIGKGETRELVLQYKVKYPKKKVITNL